ncbi:major facilitator superfamily domain-containing protein [Aspergillus cavernicola]|uniref:Major facilitator superfamily domain-containing protein n=1 Tax=Aspergillus cavernicola TaxID=176166 RepID=A0ABR4J2W8_9EURO
MKEDIELELVHDELVTIPGPPFSDDRQEYDYLLTKFDKVREAALLRKIDWRLLPVLSVFYLISYIDRANMGNARLYSLESDLGLSPQQYSWCLTIFFIPYAIFEVPSNLVLKFLKPSIWLPIIMFIWGLTMCLMGFAQNYSGLLAGRFFLGLAEAGLFPGVTYICTTWYKRYEQQKRVAIFYCAASVSGSFSGLLAYGIGFMDGIRGYHGWRWVFILEGLLTVIIALCAKPLVCDAPETSKWLTDEEKRFLALRLQFDGQESGYKEGPFQWKYMIQAFTDSTVYMNSILFAVVGMGTYSVAFGLPTTITLLGYSAANAQLLTVPVYAFAGLMTLLNAYIADRLGRRYQGVVVPFTLSIVGIIICLTVSPREKPGVIYFAMFILGGSMFPASPAVVAWIANNLAGQWKRAIGMALSFSIANLVGGCIGSNIFLERERPEYATGYRVEVAIYALGVAVSTLQLWKFWDANRRKRRILEGVTREERDRLDWESKDLGDKSPLFVYTL